MKIKIKHVDGKTDVIANIFIGTEISLEYRFQGMSYSQTIDKGVAIKLGISICSHECVQPILGFENEINGEQCLDCGKML